MVAFAATRARQWWLSRLSRPSESRVVAVLLLQRQENKARTFLSQSLTIGAGCWRNRQPLEDGLCTTNGSFSVLGLPGKEFVDGWLVPALSLQL